MKTADGSYHYCYNGQAVVDADHRVIIATTLNNTAVDVQQLIPMIEHTITGFKGRTWSYLPSRWGW